MTRLGIKVAAIMIATLTSSGASAGVYTDDLSKCLVKFSSVADQSVLVQWMFVTLSLNPAVTPLSSITPKQRDMLNQQAAALYQRLSFNDCRNETIDALKYEGIGVMEASFSVLGQVAARGLMSDPKVTSGMQDFEAFFEKDKWIQLFRAAGLTSQARQ